MTTILNRLKRSLCRLGLHWWQPVFCKRIGANEYLTTEKCAWCQKTRTGKVDSWEQM